MAILDDLPGVEVDIIVNGEALKQYEDTELQEDKRTVTRYIEAVAGQVFAVRTTLSPDFKFRGDSLSVQVFADGKKVDCVCMTEDNKEYSSEGMDVSPGLICKFRFSNLETGE